MRLGQVAQAIVLVCSMQEVTVAWVVLPGALSHSLCVSRRVAQPFLVRLSSTTPEGDEEQNDFWGGDDLEVLQGDGTDFDGNGDEGDWVPDAYKAQQRRKPKHLTSANEVLKEEKRDTKGEKSNTGKRAGPYTEEEEELIEAMGGRVSKGTEASHRREEGFLGDSTLTEIATDYSVPICYLADVLCMWGVPVPINVNDRLGDMVTGEQAFALVEAVNSLDISALQDRYSNQNILQVCAEWEIDLKDAFDFAMKEGWSLPFGVRSNLRVEQEDELLRVYSALYKE